LLNINSSYLLIGLGTALLLYLGYDQRAALTPPLVFAFILMLLYPIRKNPYASRVLWIGFILVLIWTADVISGLLAPFIIAFMLAYLFEPLIEFFLKRKISRSLSAGLLTLFGVGILFSILFYTVPLITAQADSLRNALVNLPTQLESLIHTISKHDLVQQFDLDEESLRDSLKGLLPKTETFGSYTNDFLLQAATSLPNVISTLANIILVPFLMFYFLNDFPNTKDTLFRLVPYDYRQSVDEYATLGGGIFRQYLRGQMLVALVLMVIYSILFFLIKLKYSLLLGIIYGLMCFVPYIGGIIALALSIAVAVFGDEVGRTVILILIIYGGVHALENFVLVPLIIGSKMKLNPIVVFLALFLFGHFFGFLGVLFAVPMSAFIVAIISKKVFGAPPAHHPPLPASSATAATENAVSNQTTTSA
jgi:predicted PurR-regulated permease PerM